MNKDKLVEGPFGSNACYENVIDENTTLGCVWVAVILHLH